jgi:hypothetical protein
LGTAKATNDADITKLLHGAPAGFMHVKNAIMGEGVDSGKLASDTALISHGG